MEKFKMNGKVVIITGASSGMGKRSAELLAEAGAKVFVTARREERLAELKKQIETSGGTAEYYACDLAVEENCKAIVDECIKKFGRVDGLVNCAGLAVGPPNLAAEFDTELWNKVMQLDLYAPMFMVKYAYPEMEKVGGGSIVNISSFGALQHRGALGAALAYSSAKGAVKSMSMVLAAKFAPLKIRVNSIYPGLIKTEMTSRICENEAILSRITPTIPLGTYGVPDDIAYGVLYLLSDASAYITGKDIVIDGGYT